MHSGLPYDWRGKGLLLTIFCLTVTPPPSNTFVLHLPGAGQEARVVCISLVSVPPGVVGEKEKSSYIIISLMG
jgi:hypothetical protein